MNRISFDEACLPKPWQVLGLRLRPLCLGHYFHLRRFDCAFVAEESREARLVDVVLAVLVCSMTYEEFSDFLQSDWTDEVKKWGGECGNFNLDEKIIFLNQYFAEGSRQPTVLYECETDSSGCHWSQALKVALIRLGYTKSEAMNLPLTEAFMDFYRDAESKGIVSICDEHTAELLDMDAEGFERMAAETGGQMPPGTLEKLKSVSGDVNPEPPPHAEPR